MTKLAIITGASRGIGESIARRMARAGFDVALVARSESAMIGIATTIKSESKHANIGTFVCDLAQPDVIPEAFTSITKFFGKNPSVLINNAGYGGPYQRVEQASADEWRRVQAVNLESSFVLSKLAIPGMVELGWGRIINISSVYGHLGGAGSGAYSAAKHGVIGLTKTIAAESGSKGITCNVVCPGFTDTPMIADMKNSHPDLMKSIVRQIPAGRIGTPDEVSELVAFLASEHANYINGAEIVIDGGMSAHVGFF